MLQHSEAVTIDAGLDNCWSFVSDMANWASNMPGYQTYDVRSATDSVWTLKVGVGALVKTVRVMVHIEEWRQPDRVGFTYRLENEPVDGDGHYEAHRLSDTETGVTLFVQVRGGGPMAPVWEAMARPILPKLAGDFGSALKTMIEAKSIAPLASPIVPRPPENPLWRIVRWLSGLLGRGREGAKAGRLARDGSRDDREGA